MGQSTTVAYLNKQNAQELVFGISTVVHCTTWTPTGDQNGMRYYTLAALALTSALLTLGFVEIA